MKRFFAYDCENGFLSYDTEAEAIKDAEGRLDYLRDCAIREGEWPDDVDAIVVGCVTHRIKETTTTGYEGEVYSDYALERDDISATPAGQKDGSEAMGGQT